ncbi:MAG TPA: aspartate aminotransferase family protein, partial [Thermodesulfobacterium commune]|nr:aspartate aminotransferase family protein [Thermodesulfobacterium commune]
MERIRSQLFYKKALEVIPGGVNSPVRACKAVKADPVFFERGEGAY